MTTPEQIHSIVTRHRADSSEASQFCRACGRPWPCDVRQLAAIYAREATSVTASLADRNRVWRAAGGRRVTAEALAV